MQVRPLCLILTLLSAPAALAMETDARYEVRGLKEANPIVEEINLARAMIRYELALDIQRQVYHTLSQQFDHQVVEQELEEEEVSHSAAASGPLTTRHCRH
ncbi:hypothetical protein [Ferrimonas balearica]|uniref:hypothetical protein n=1 Tax=Ferrimonas balearica TaxID=44012 RepID=UPI001C9A03B6|nr:hypothetical protein [Ferrimonas balearica]MBY5992731.1 hypothetical protein [Ferrimonas balearica]